MKKVYTSDVKFESFVGNNVTIPGWVKSVRRHKNTVFVDLADSTGFIQTIIDKSKFTHEFLSLLDRLTEE